MSDFYLITEEQLRKLQVLTWGARMIFSHEPKAFNDTLDAIRAKPLTYDPYSSHFILGRTEAESKTKLDFTREG